MGGVVTLGRVLLEHLIARLRTTIFLVVYGGDPPRLLSYFVGTTRVDALDRALLKSDEFLS